jgi:hypothetical protein
MAYRTDYKNADSWFSSDLNSLKEPKRKNLFLVRFGKDLGDCWFAKGVSKPVVSFDSGGSLLDGSAFFGEPFLTKDRPAINYSPVTLTLVDPNGPDMTTYFISLMKDSSDSNRNNYIDPRKISKALEKFEILQVSPKEPSSGKMDVIERWELESPLITKMDFGSLDYSSEDLLEISLEVEYNGFKYTPGDGSDTYLQPLYARMKAISDIIK